MRVISGKCRGAKLVAPEGVTTRPTIDRIKETLFNMISFDIPGCKFLDLFSGSGGIAIESLSRGAKKAVLVEKDPVALKAIEQNLTKTKLKSEATVLAKEIDAALELLAQKGESFDIIYMDPPYNLPNQDKILQKIYNSGLISQNGYIIVERASDSIVPEVPHLVLWKEKRYTTTTLSFFRKESDQ